MLVFGKFCVRTKCVMPYEHLTLHEIALVRKILPQKPLSFLLFFFFFFFFFSILKIFFLFFIYR